MRMYLDNVKRESRKIELIKNKPIKGRGFDTFDH